MVSVKETEAVSATKPKIVCKKTEHTAATPSEPTVSRGRRVSRKRRRGSRRARTNLLMVVLLSVSWHDRVSQLAAEVHVAQVMLPTAPY